MRLIILLAMTFFLGACTSEKGDLKSLAESKGETYLKLKLSQEAYGSSDLSPYLKEAYIEFMLKRATIKAADPQFAPSGGEAKVDLVMTLYSQNLRKTLLGVAAKTSPNRVRSFNFTDAIGLIAQQGEDLSSEMVDQPLATLSFSKSASGWSLQPD